MTPMQAPHQPLPPDIDASEVTLTRCGDGWLAYLDGQGLADRGPTREAATVAVLEGAALVRQLASKWNGGDRE